MSCQHNNDPAVTTIFCRQCDDERKAIERDALRYRFLRAPSDALQRIGRQNIVIGRFNDDLDEAVDAAMKS